MKWINFLHLYQPANTNTFNIEEANEKSYKRILRALEKNKNLRFSLNIAGCLIQRWEEMGEADLIKRYFSLVKSGQIELTGTAMYHPILPLIPEDEVKRQIIENEEILKKYMGPDYRPRGFFLPEMAYSPRIAKIVKELGYDWLIVDEIIFSGKLNETDTSKAYKDKNSGLFVVARSRDDSNTFVPSHVSKLMKKDSQKIVVTGTDAELYGLRHIDHTAEFEKLVSRQDLDTELISDFISAQKNPTEVALLSGNWNSSEEEIKAGKPFAVWYNKKNKIQMKLWDMQSLVYQAVYNFKEDENFYWARWHLVRGLISCNYWWASEKDFMLFSGVTWNPDEIERGINDLTRAVRSLNDKDTKDIKIKIEKLAADIRFRVWEKHWKTHWK